MDSHKTLANLLLQQDNLVFHSNVLLIQPSRYQLLLSLQGRNLLLCICHKMSSVFIANTYVCTL